LLTFSWSKESGPGSVTFANPNLLSTTASFSSSGTYVLRLTVSDGVLSGTDDISITANGQTVPPLQILSVDIVAGTPPLLHFRFLATAGQTFTIQFRDSLTTGGGWSKLTDVPAQGVDQMADITDPISQNSTQRFYRVVSPRQP
jgi:hypothetical protein